MKNHFSLRNSLRRNAAARHGKTSANNTSTSRRNGIATRIHAFAFSRTDSVGGSILLQLASHRSAPFQVRAIPQGFKVVFVNCPAKMGRRSSWPKTGQVCGGGYTRRTSVQFPALSRQQEPCCTCCVRNIPRQALVVLQYIFLAIYI